jgi:hypothetical protein
MRYIVRVMYPNSRFGGSIYSDGCNSLTKACLSLITHVYVRDDNERVELKWENYSTEWNKEFRLVHIYFYGMKRGFYVTNSDHDIITCRGDEIETMSPKIIKKLSPLILSIQLGVKIKRKDVIEYLYKKEVQNDIKRVKRSY